MPKWITAGRCIRYKEHESRKHGKRPDRYWCIQYKLNGKTVNEAVGWWSMGASQAECEDLLGKLRENWRSGQGPQTLREMRATAKAQKEKAELQQKIEQNQSFSLSEFWAEKYHPDIILHKSKNSARTELLLFEKWLKPLSNILLQDINVEMIETKVVRPLMKAGRTPRTIEYVLAVLSQMWNMARKYDMITGDNPVKKAKKPRKDNKRERFLTKDEALRLLADLKIRSKIAHDISLLSLFTGMRSDECLSVIWADVDFKQKSIFVKDTKNTRNRHAFMTSEVEEMLKERYSNQSAAQLVFPNSLGKKNDWGVTGAFFRAVQKLALNDGITDSRQKVVFHTLRHTFGSWLVQKGEPLYNVMELMGHRSIQMTMRYAHLAPKNLKNSAMRLDGALSMEGDDV